MVDNKQNIVVVGICGGIATGKSSLVKKCQENLNCPVFSADLATYKAYQDPQIIAQIAEIAPACIENGNINKQALNDLVMQDETLLNKIESIIHPFVKREAEKFISENNDKNIPLIILEIPLMFTSGMDKLCNITIALTVPKRVCKGRALRRGNMTPEKFEFIYKHQQEERIMCKQNANIVIADHGNYIGTNNYILNICNKLINKHQKVGTLRSKHQKQRGY